MSEGKEVGLKYIISTHEVARVNRISFPAPKIKREILKSVLEPSRGREAISEHAQTIPYVPSVSSWHPQSTMLATSATRIFIWCYSYWARSHRGEWLPCIICKCISLSFADICGDQSTSDGCKKSILWRVVDVGGTQVNFPCLMAVLNPEGFHPRKSAGY